MKKKRKHTTYFETQQVRMANVQNGGMPQPTKYNGKQAVFVGSDLGVTFGPTPRLAIMAAMRTN